MSKNLLKIVYDLLINSSIGELNILKKQNPTIYETILEVASMDEDFPNKNQFVDMFLTEDMDNWKNVSKSLQEELLYMVYEQLKEREVFYIAVFTKNSFKLIQELMGLEKKINMVELKQNKTKFNAWVKTWLPNTKKKFIEKFRPKITTESHVNKWYKLKNMMHNYKVEREEKFEQEYKLNSLLDMVYDQLKEREVFYRAVSTKNSFKSIQELMGLEIVKDELMEMDEKEFDAWVNTWLPTTKKKIYRKIHAENKNRKSCKKVVQAEKSDE